MSADGTAVRVVVTGAAGRMGRMAAATVAADPGFALVAVVDPAGAGRPLSEFAGPDAPALDVRAAVAEVDFGGEPGVLLDLTHGDAAVANARAAVYAGWAAVIGATGLPAEGVADLDARARAAGVPALIVPNFAIGAVLMMRFAEWAAAWLPDAEIVELHHDGKRDAPSGTARETARRIARARGGPRPIPGAGPAARGDEADGVPIHSVRLPGLVAHQATLFGGQGETLTIRHDSLDRSSFMGGIRLAIAGVRRLPPGVAVGLDVLLFDSADTR